jgi:hypothetical protein
MSAHSKFPRRQHDEYITPPDAAARLIRYLRRDGVATFAEPCCAQGQLIRLIEQTGPLCIHSSDIQSGIDALTDPVLRRLIVDAIITNPPFTWAILKPMLDLFPAIAPTWLLLEATFAFQEQGQPFMTICTDIVPIGQIRWFPGSKHKSFVRYAWYRFDGQHDGTPPYFHRLEKLRKTKDKTHAEQEIAQSS